MKNRKLFKFVLSAAFAAMIFAATAYLPRVPILGGAGGYVHVGDTFIYLAACTLPLPYAMLAAAVGGSLADALTGYMIWAPATFVIKALMVLPFSSKGVKFITWRNGLATVAAGLICAAGYYIYEAAAISNFAAALASVPFNLIQGLASAALYLAAGFALDRAKLKPRLLS
jgi:TIGR04002 family protein